MKPVSRFFLIGMFAAGVWGFTGTAQAGTDLSWSLTLGTPGVAVGVVQPGPVYYGAPPVYYRPPIYVQPRPVYRVPPGHYRPLHRARPHLHRHRHPGKGPRSFHRGPWRHHR